MTARGIVGFGGYVPWWRIPRAAIAGAHGGSGKGARAVASYDEDATSMAVEAGRLALRPLGDHGRHSVRQLLFTSTAPSYVDKTNATTVHAGLRLDRTATAFDLNGAMRSAAGALQLALQGRTTTLVTMADLRTGLPNSPDERDGGDGASALLIGDDTEQAPVLAEFLGGASATEEFVDRWRTPGDNRSKQWEERFGEMRYGPLAAEAWKRALEATGLAPDDLTSVGVVGSHARAVKQAGGKVSAGVQNGLTDDLTGVIGNAGAAHLGLVLASMLEAAEPGHVLGVLSLADGADVFLFRATDALRSWRPIRSVAAQITTGNDDPGLPYLKFLSWKGMAAVQPPNRPEPARASSSAAARNEGWKYGFVGSVDSGSGTVHLPPARVSFRTDAVDAMAPQPMADAEGTIVTFTVDRLAYSPSPPVVFAVVDFDEAAGGGRMPIELTDVDAATVAIGDRVRMTFRRLNQSDGIQNYFWKAVPVR